MKTVHERAVEVLAGKSWDSNHTGGLRIPFSIVDDERRGYYERLAEQTILALKDEGLVIIDKAVLDYVDLRTREGQASIALAIGDDDEEEGM